METKVVYDPVPVFLANKDVDTLVYVHEIAKNDQKLTVDVYTRKGHHARQALEDLRTAIDEMLDEWHLLTYRVLPLVTDDKGKPLFDRHDRAEWDLRIHWPEVPKKAKKG